MADILWTRRCPVCKAALAKRDPTAPWVCDCGWRGIETGMPMVSPIGSENCLNQEDP